MTKIPCWIVLALAAGVSGSQAVVTLTLDDFTDAFSPVNPLTANAVIASATDVTNLTVPDVAGAIRTTTAEYLGGPVSVEATLALGTLIYSSGVGTNGRLTLDYNFGGARDLTLAGGDSFVLEIIASDHPAVTGLVELTATSQGGVMSSTESVPFVIGDASVPFSDFTGGVDFTEITNVSIGYNVDTAFDGSISLIGVSSPDRVPDGGISISLLGLSLLGLAGLGRLAKTKL